MKIASWEFESPPLHILIIIIVAEIAQLVEHNLAKVGVASSNLVSRSIGFKFREFLPGWRNGRRKGLKIPRIFFRAGSSPALGTTFLEVSKAT